MTDGRWWQQYFFLIIRWEVQKLPYSSMNVHRTTNITATELRVDGAVSDRCYELTNALLLTINFQIADSFTRKY